jgi:two-component system catabolic regulation response regulator CreB
MPQTILIVEDESAIAQTLIWALGTDGFAPHHVTLGQEALLWLQANPAPALIVLDVGLPDISGFDVLRRLRQFSNTPVIFLTARNDEIDRVVGLEMGADDYVSKPFSPRELVARIRAVLRRPPLAAPASVAAHASAHTSAPTQTSVPTHASAPTHTSAPAHASAPATPPRFELRAAQARILYHGHLLHLTRYEYQLLKTFLERPGQLFSRAQLMDSVWTDAPDTLDRTVDAHIKSIRAKLRAITPGLDPLQTHRGMGYSLDAT